MRQCLTAPRGGYYTSERSPFGQKGDFITSPEISQVFGELLGIWLVSEWMIQGKAQSGVELVEIGPGRGTLMDDMLRTVCRFKSYGLNIERVHLVETSASLRETQKKLLCGENAMKTTESGFESKSTHSGIPIAWTEDLRLISRDSSKSPFIFAHEFFDALPINAFESVADSSTASTSWRELVVTTAPASKSPEFQLSLSRGPTRNSLLLPETSRRYKALKRQVGSIIEICPEGLAYVEEIARRIGGSDNSTKSKPSGAALILDYGPVSTIPVNSLRGISKHKLVSPFSFPGLVDVSADVDFTALAEAALKASSGVEVHGPVEQGQLLECLGIEERARQLMNGVQDEETMKRIDGGWKRLVERGGGSMGRLYKALAIVPERGGMNRPVGFGGDVVL